MVLIAVLVQASWLAGMLHPRFFGVVRHDEASTAEDVAFGVWQFLKAFRLSFDVESMVVEISQTMAQQ